MLVLIELGGIVILRIIDPTQRNDTVLSFRSSSGENLEQFLSNTNPDLTVDEIRQLMDTVRLVGADSDFATLHKVYAWMVNGIQFTPQDGLSRMVALLDFEHPESNIFRVVNQFTVEYVNNGITENRRPDVLLLISTITMFLPAPLIRSAFRKR